MSDQKAHFCYAHVSFILFLTGLEYKRSTLKYGSVSEFWDWHITLMKNNMDSVVFDKAIF